MHSFGSGVILLGMTIIILAQIVGAIMVFNVSFIKGLFSLTIPGYFLFALRREGMYRQIIGSWLFGILCLAIGTVILS
jgi:hypothetical protein